MGHRSRYHDGLACFPLPVGRLPWVPARTFAGLEAFLVLSVVYLLSNTAYGIIGKDSMRVWVPWCVQRPPFRWSSLQLMRLAR